MKTYRKYLQERSGQTIVEFALIVALLLAILFGILEFGRAWFYSNHLTNSVRSTARYAAVLDNFSTNNGREIRDYLIREIDTFMPAENIDSISVGYRPGGTGPLKKNFNAISQGDTIVVGVTYDFQILSGSIIPFFSGTRQLTRSASMPYE